MTTSTDSFTTNCGYPCRVMAMTNGAPALCWTMSPTFEVWASGRGIELHGDLPAADVANLVQLLHVAYRVHRDLKRGVGTEAVMRSLIGR
jgi:hypothetical protein